MNVLDHETDQCTLKAIALYESIGISNNEELSIKEITDQYNEMIKQLEKSCIKDSVYYFVR